MLQRLRKVPSSPQAKRSVEDLFRQTYFEVVDYVLQAIHAQFDQHDYRILSKLEELLCKKYANIDDIYNLYGNDINTTACSSQQPTK